MNSTASPAGPLTGANGLWSGDAMRRRVARRYAAERRFRAIGLVAVVLSASFLLFLLFTMAAAGLSGFSQTRITVPVDFKASGLTVKLDGLSADEAGAILNQQGLPDILGMAMTKGFGAGADAWLGGGAATAARDAILADPAILTAPATLTLPAAAAIDTAAKSGDRDDPAASAAVAKLRTAGALGSGIDRAFLTNADATDPTIAGIWGALKGSLLTMLVTLSLAFPVGVLAALYLEEYAPRGRLTDIIEVSINNLAAVPSIIFGLLALALFINGLGLCQGSPLVGGLTLALMTMPVIVISGRNAIKSVPPSIRDAALGVGASRVQVVFHHVLPLALPGILTGTIIGMARALGETAPLLLVGMRAFVGGAPSGLCSNATVLPMQIYLWSDEVNRGFVENTSAAIIVLLIVLLSMNALAIYLRNKFETRW